MGNFLSIAARAPWAAAVANGTCPDFEHALAPHNGDGDGKLAKLRGLNHYISTGKGRNSPAAYNVVSSIGAHE